MAQNRSSYYQTRLRQLEPDTSADRQRRFGSFQEYRRSFATQPTVQQVAEALPSFKARDIQDLHSAIPDQLPDEARHDLGVIIGNEDSLVYSPDNVRQLAIGLSQLEGRLEYPDLAEVSKRVFRDSEFMHMPTKRDMKQISPTLVVRPEYNRPENSSYKLLWWAKTAGGLGFKDLMLPDINVRFFDTGNNSGLVANGGFMAFDFMDLGNADGANNRSFIRDHLLGNREVRKLLDLAQAKVIYDDRGIRIFVTLPQANQLGKLGVNMSGSELKQLKKDLREVLLGLDGRPAVHFRPLGRRINYRTAKTRMPIEELMKLHPKTIFEEILSNETPDHVKTEILKYHWVKDPGAGTLILHPSYSADPHQVSRIKLLEEEALKAAEHYNTYPEIKFKFYNDFSPHEFGLYRASKTDYY